MTIAGVPNTNTAGFIERPPVNVRRYSLRDFLTTLFYHRRVMLLAFIVPVALGIAAAAVTKPVFIGQARLLVLYGSEYFYQPSAGQPGSSVALDRNEIITGELQVLRSTDLATETLQAVGVDRVYPGTPTGDPAALGKAAQRMANDLSLTSIPQSNILELSFRSYDPAVASDVLRTLIAKYLAHRIAIFQRSPTAAAQADQEIFLGRLHAAEAALASFADAHGIANLDEQLNLLLQQQSGNSQARDATAQAISETAARLAVVQDERQKIPPTTQSYADSDRSQQTQLLTDSLVRLRMKRRELATRYDDAYPEMQSLDRQIQWAQAQIASDPTRESATARTGPNPLFQDLQAQAVALQAQLNGLQAKQVQLAADAAAIETRIRDLDRSAGQYRDLKRTRDVLDDSYRNFVKSNEEAQMADNAERSRTANIRVVQQPEATAASLNLRKILVALGAVAGVAAALAAMALCNAFNQVFVTARDVGVGLDLPVLAVVDRRGRRAPAHATLRA